jgi:hypothetical protein
LSRNPIINGMPKPTKGCSARKEEDISGLGYD